MKKYQTVFLMAVVALSLSNQNTQAQNIQLHYDTGNALWHDQLADGRPKLTSTIELFRPDQWGSTYFFTDIDYFTTGAGAAYWEISREISLLHPSAQHSYAAHIEYNGGLSSNKPASLNTRIQHAALIGPAWNWHSTDYRRTFSLQAMYKYYFRGAAPYQKSFSSFQLTEVWGMELCQGKLTFSGFCDLWYNPDVNGKLILLSEPQLWLNVGKLFSHSVPSPLDPLSIGTEIEISNNFVFTDKGSNNRFFIIPTLACKWSF